MADTPAPSPAALVAQLRAGGSVFAEDEAGLLLTSARDAADLVSTVARRVAGEPLEYVLGWAEFCGLRIAVEAGVFRPRPRTEWLALEASTLCRPGAVVVDLCCGTGAVGAALVARHDQLELYAVDIDPVAVRCALQNVGASGDVFEGDLYQPLPTSLHGRVDVLVANAPYVPTDEIAFMPPEARLHEAPVALDGGSDGLDIQRRVAADAPRWLAVGGHLLVETSERQAPASIEALRDAGLVARVSRCAEMDATIVIASLPMPAHGSGLRLPRPPASS